MTGIFEFPSTDDEELLVELIVVDNSTGRRGNWFGVQEHDVRQACDTFGLDYEEIMQIIEAKDPGTHTLLIDVPTYLEARK